MLSSDLALSQIYYQSCKLGGNADGVTPVLIPNTEVKPIVAYDSALRAKVGRRQIYRFDRKTENKKMTVWSFFYLYEI